MFKQALPADAALTDQQEENLITAMYQERKDTAGVVIDEQSKRRPIPTDRRTRCPMEKQMEQLQQRYADRAAAILTPAQLEQFTKWQQQMNSMQAAGLKMAAQMLGNKGAAPTPAPSQGATP